ncbi:MAG: RidA family protein, partial [Betaproteobacteria bacterium]|nr:RidA family protein [Betaproteobacteria bacterium]
MDIQRKEIGPRLSEAVIHQNTVYLTGQVADDGCGPDIYT